MSKQAENPATVLVVNDDRAARELITDILEPQGYKIISATNAHEALEITSARLTDVIISDVVMPGMDGMDLCRRLKTNPATSDTPVLLVTAIRKEDADFSEGFAAGADEYIEIPFRHEELLVKVARLSERHRVERRYREIVENAADIIYTHNMDGIVTSINEAGARFFGLPASGLIGQRLGGLIGEDIVALNIEELQNRKFSAPVRFIHCLKNAVSEERYLEGILTLEQDSTAKPVGVRAVVRDVTERQRAEDALKRQSDEYRILFDSNPCPMYVVDESTLNFLAVNDTAINHYGYSREEFLSMTALEIRPEEEVPALMEYVEKAMSANQEAAVVWKHRKKDGALIDVEVNWHRLDFGGRPAYLVSATDVTEQKRAAVAMLESEERYRELFENANDIIYTHDLAGNFTSLNKTGERVTGYTCEEALRMNIADVLTPESVNTAKQKLARREIGGTPETVPAKYAERSPLSYARRIAESCVPVQIWWSRTDETVLDSVESGKRSLCRTLRGAAGAGAGRVCHVQTVLRS